MPNKRGLTKGFPCKPEDCYESRHLEASDYKIYDLMCAAAPLKDGKRIFYASVEGWLCNAANQSRSAVDRTLDRLEAAGWIISLGRTRRPNGTETPNAYEVLDHDQFIAKHPGTCPPYIYAPTWEVAKEFGLKKGDKLASSHLPKTFRPDSALGRALAKIATIPDDSDSEGYSPTAAATIVTDEETDALNKHLAKRTKPLSVDADWQPLSVDADHSALALTGTTQRGRGTPLSVDAQDHSALTLRNPSKPTIVERPEHTPTPDSEAAEECVCVLLQRADQKWKWNPPVGNVKEKILNHAKQHRREKFLAAGGAFISEDHSFNKKTYSPWSTFADNFLLYLKNATEKPKGLTEELIAKSNEISRRQHEAVWALPEEKPEPGADAFITE
jgi:hypothetical protein